MELEKQLRKLFSETFNVPEEKITLSTKPSTLEEWDSLGQLRLFMNMESEFQTSFHVNEIKDLNSFEMLLNHLKEKKCEML